MIPFEELCTALDNYRRRVDAGAAPSLPPVPMPEARPVGDGDATSSHALPDAGQATAPVTLPEATSRPRPDATSEIDLDSDLVG